MRACGSEAMQNEKPKLASFFTNDNPRKVWSLVDDAPEWLKDAVQAAHHNREDLPNDWIYSEIRDVCTSIDCGAFDGDEDARQDYMREYADGPVDIYTKGLYQWQADMCQTSTYAYAEERLADMGSEGLNGEKRVAALQYYAIEFIAETVVSAWAESLEDSDDQSENDE